MAKITSLETDNPKVALIIAAHNAATLDAQGAGSADLADAMRPDVDTVTAKYIERFQQIYAALVSTTGVEDDWEDDEDDDEDEDEDDEGEDEDDEEPATPPMVSPPGKGSG